MSIYECLFKEVKILLICLLFKEYKLTNNDQHICFFIGLWVMLVIKNRAFHSYFSTGPLNKIDRFNNFDDFLNHELHENTG